jgi:hypothetical protein
VNFSPTLKWLVSILLPLTLAWKLTVKADNNDRLEDDAIAFVTRQGFDVTATEDGHFYKLMAVNSSCRMRMMIASGNGADRDMLRALLAADETLIFVYQGRVYQEHLFFLTVLSELWTRALRKIGLTYRHESVLAVMAQRQCNAGRLPWSEIRSDAAKGKLDAPRATEVD